MKPSIVFPQNDDADALINCAGIIRWIFEMDAETLAEMRGKGNGDIAAAVERMQARGRSAIAAESLKARPRGLDSLLWDVFHGEELEAWLRAHPGRADEVKNWIMREGAP
jgi:hypothetical protein